MKKKPALILALTLAMAMAVPTLANAVSVSGGTDDTELSYTVQSSFAVTIPPSVALVPETPENGDLTVSITNIDHGTVIKAAITQINGDDANDDFLVIHASDTTKTVAYAVKSSLDGTTYTDYTKGTKVGALSATGSIRFQYTLEAIPANHPAGEYKGTVTFTIYNEAP